LRADDGTQLWTHALDTNAEPGGSNSLAVSGSALYLAENAEPQGPSAGPSGQLIALDAKTGSPLWHADAGGIVQGLSAGASAIYAAAIVYNTLVPSIPPTATVIAYSPSDGKSLWSHPISNGLPQGLFGATSTGIYLPVISKTAAPQPASAFDALSLTDGSPQWTYALDGILVGWLAATAL
jgi:outer membrane protein assembly factor BamB